MNTENVIEVNNVHKIFRVYSDKGRTLKERILFHKRNQYEERNVLDGISFNIRKGETVAIIGKNGCGKSTTLKLLTKILRSNSGTIAIKGRVSCLIELGAGFHPDMSGRENIYINASIFGIKEAEVNRRIDEIIRFSELEDYIDNPVRTYSSGMYMRLAFAVAINVDADILLIDEILAVGDSSFQQKCFDKLCEIKEKGTTIVIVSHSVAQIRNICDRAIWLHDGKVADDGELDMVYQEYMQKMGEERKIRKQKESQQYTNVIEADKQKHNDVYEISPLFGEEVLREGDFEAEFTRIIISNAIGEETDTIKTGEKASILFQFYAKPGAKLNIGFTITRNDWVLCYGVCTAKEDIIITGNGEQQKVLLEMDQNILLTGNYYLSFYIMNEDNTYMDYIKYGITLHVVNEKKVEDGLITIKHQWKR